MARETRRATIRGGPVLLLPRNAEYPYLALDGVLA